MGDGEEKGLGAAVESIGGAALFLEHEAAHHGGEGECDEGGDEERGGKGRADVRESKRGRITRCGSEGGWVI